MRYVGLFSGGKDSLVACHFLGVRDVLYCRTGIGLDDNVEYVRSTCEKMGWHLNVVEPKEGESYEDFIRKFGFPRQGMHSSIMGYLKYHPMRKFARENPDVVFVSGRRRGESVRRRRIAKMQDENVDGMRFYAPLLYWSTSQVWDYIRKHKLRICPVYETMHMSGDCFCGAFGTMDEVRMLKTFHTDMACRIEELEKRYGGKWGNFSSMRGVMQEASLDGYLCSDCALSLRM